MCEIETRVKKLISDVFELPLEQITTETSSENIEKWDSINLINLMLSVETEFGVAIDVGQAIRLNSVKSIVDIVKNKLN